MVSKSRLGLLGGIIAVATLMCTSALGQGSPQGRVSGRMMGGGRRSLLNIKEVQAELKMTPAQIAKLDAKQKAMMQGMPGRPPNPGAQGRTGQPAPGGRPGPGGGPGPGGRQGFMAMQEKMASEILDAAQMKRYKQLRLQQEGPFAFTRSEVAGELKLSSDQKTRIQNILQTSFRNMNAALQGVDLRNMTDADRQKFSGKMAAIRKSESDQIMAVLNSNQRTQWQKMLGKPFTFPTRGGMRPMGGSRVPR